MKDLKHTLCAAALAAGLLTGNVALAEEAPAEDAPASSAAIAAEEGSAPIGLPNPYIEYPDVPALERAIGFPVLYLPNNFYALYHPAAHVFGIGGQVADLRFKSQADDSTITLRTALLERVRVTDISGYHGVEWSPQTAGDVKRTRVEVAVTPDGTRVVRWSAGRFVYALALSGFDEAAFKPILKNFVAVADRFAHKYRNFTLNKPRKKTPAADAPTAADTQAAASVAEGAPTDAAEKK